MKEKNNLAYTKKFQLIIFFLIILLFTFYLNVNKSFSFYTNFEKYYNVNSAKVDGYSGFALERDSQEFIVDGCGFETILDTLTGLCWQRHLFGIDNNVVNIDGDIDLILNFTNYNSINYGGSCLNGLNDGKTCWYGAKAYCDNLILGGYSDWRLPERDEFKTICNEIRELEITRPTILESFGFISSNSLNYWETTYWTVNTVMHNNQAWTIWLPSGDDGYSGGTGYTKISNGNVICVRRDY